MPLSWVLLTAAVVGSVTVTCVLVAPWWVTVLVTAVTAAVAAALLWNHSATVVVDEQGLRAGRASVGWEWVASARVLTPEEVEDRDRGRTDVRAHRLLRAYLPGVVRVELADPADPHPAWLVSSRHPEELAAAVRSQLARHGQGVGV